MLYGSPPSYQEIRVFGCLAYAHNQSRGGDKFSSRARKCIFVGYSPGKKVWKLYDVDTNEFLVSRVVEFCEHVFPHKSETEPGDDRSIAASRGGVAAADRAVGDSGEAVCDEVTAAAEGDQPVVTEAVGLTEELDHGHRQKQPSTRLRDYVTHTVEINSPSPRHPNHDILQVRPIL